MTTVEDVADELGRRPKEVLAAARKLGIVASSEASALSSVEHQQLRDALGAPADLPPVPRGSQERDPGRGPVDDRTLQQKHADLLAGAHAHGRARRGVNPAKIIRIIVSGALVVTVLVAVRTISDVGDTAVSYLGFTSDDEGACVDLGSGADQVVEVTCVTPHDAELFAVIELDEATIATAAAAVGVTTTVADDGAVLFPGGDVVIAAAEVACGERFVDYVGTTYEESDLDVVFLVPTEATWADDDRSALCLIEDPDGPLVGRIGPEPDDADEPAG